jgi:acid phosphatase
MAFRDILRTALFVSLGTVAGVGVVATPAPAKTKLPKPDHVIIVMEENHSYSEIIGSASAPYINSLAQSGASFTDSHAVTHPSQPNYLELFSGSTQGVTDDSCPHSFSADSEASELIAAGLSFVGYSEGLPSEGSLVCTSGEYARKHSPWTNFTNLPVTANEPFTAYPKKLKKLPKVAWVIPNLEDDMHDGTIAQGDTWLKNNLSAYATWAMTHNSLLIVTWDEDDGSQSNQIPTIFVGPMVKQGEYGEKITHDNVLATIEAMYGLTPLGNSASAAPIKDVWQ